MKHIQLFEQFFNESLQNFDTDKFLIFIEDEMRWNSPEMSEIKKNTQASRYVDNVINMPEYKWEYAFKYQCMPGSSVIPELKEAIKKFDKTLKPVIRRGLETGHRSAKHDYYIFLK